MLESQGAKIMFDLHGLSVNEVKKLLDENFAKITQLHIGEFYIITGRGNHVNANGRKGVLKKILPKLLKPYCQDILQVNAETGAYKIILKPQQEVTGLKELLTDLWEDEKKHIEYAKILQQQAANNDIESLLALATIHIHQAIKGFDKVNEGIKLLLKAKQLGSLDADVQLGILYHEGRSVEQQHEKAFKYFLFAAQKGHPIAQYYVAVCYLHGKGVRYNDKQAVAWMKKAADQGDAYAQDALGDFYLLGKITTQNYQLGIEYKKKAAEQGLAEAQIDLARCYATGGYEIEKNYQTAFEYYLAAAQSNKPYAVYQVGAYLFAGRTGLAPNPTTAFDWFLRAAKLNDGDGQAQVAYQYLFGIGVSQDLEQGLEWLSKAVKQKSAYGNYVMAIAHLKGLGVEQDGLKAYQFMEQAAKGGNSDAQHALGILLCAGQLFFDDIPNDFDKGFNWFKKAMEQGDRDAAEIVKLFFEKKRDNPELIYARISDEMQALLTMPNILSVEAKSAREASFGKSDNLPKDASQQLKKAEDKAEASAVTTVSSTNPQLFKPAKKSAKRIKNAEQATLQDKKLSHMDLSSECSRVMSQGKQLNSSNIDFYTFGELCYLLCNISLYMTNKAYEKDFKQMFTQLYGVFEKRASHFGVIPPKKKPGEMITDYTIRYINDFEITLKEKQYTLETFQYGLGFQMMSIKMMEFTKKGDEVELVQELVGYLNHIHKFPWIVNINKLFIDKITDVLNKQLQKPKKEFYSKEFITRFNLLEEELKTQLLSPITVNEWDYRFPSFEVSDYLSRRSSPTSSNLDTYSSQLSRYSVWSKRVLAVGLAATAIGIALVQREEIAETAKTICKLQ